MATKKTKAAFPQASGDARAVEIDAGVIRRAMARRGEGRERIADTVCKGLRLVVGARGATFEYSYRPRGFADGGKRHPQRTVRVGDVTTHTINEARAAADSIKEEVRKGGDPVTDSRRASEVKQTQAARRVSISTAAETYITSRLNAETKHGRGEAAHVRAAIVELKCGVLEPAELRVADLRRLANLHRDRPATGVHRVGALSRFLDSLVDDEIIESNPARMLSRHARPKPAKARASYPDAAEVQALWQAAEKISGAKGDYLQCMLLLPFRRAELADAPVSAFDATAGQMVLAGAVTKNGDDFAIPCPEAARSVLKARAKAAGNVRGALLFPMSTAADATMFHCYSDLIEEWRKESGVQSVKFHDLRRLFVSELAEHQIGDADLADSLLNHRQAETRGGVKGAYQRAKLIEPRRRMMDAWGRLVAHAVEHGVWPRDKDDDEQVVSIAEAR